MASVHEYKRLENRLVQKVKSVALIAAGFIASIFRAIGKFFTRRYTLVFVPHSEKKVYNLHVTVLSCCCFLLVFFGIIGAFFFYGVSHSDAVHTMMYREGLHRQTQASLDEFRDEIPLFLREAANFQNALEPILSALGIRDRNNLSQNTVGDLNFILGIRETPQGLSPEADGLNRFSAYLSEVIDPIIQLGAILDSQITLLREIPSIWPVRNGLGFITMFFGQNVHPFFGQYYIHRGIDIATGRFGDPIVATADGQVMTVEFESSYGNFIIIRHKHGYYTRYAHLQNFRVQVGQQVQQGEIIGYIGSTGLSTGPHLHYEVHIGSDVVDPFRFITMRNSLSRQRR
jgi:murein DD-endopeptidase MepM/ murein hydrolase activator NlpD